MSKVDGDQRPSGKLESLPKDELLKFIKRQAINSKDLKKKITDLEEALAREKEEVGALELEKKEWISRGVSAEFEKKDRIVKKDRELELAARLAAEMLEENDELHGALKDQKRDQDGVLMHKVLIQLADDKDRLTLQMRNNAEVHEEQIMAKVAAVEQLSEDKMELQRSLSKLQGEFETTVLESQDLRDKLLASEQECTELMICCDENKTLKDKIKDLEYQLANPVKYNKLREEYDELGKANKMLKDDKMLAEQDRTAKSEQILLFDKDIKNLRQEVAEKNRIIKEKKLAMEALKVTNNELNESLKAAETKCQDLQGEIHKNSSEKEKYLKAIKSMKTKMERTALIEEELRKQLNTIVGERDEMIKKNLKRTQKARAKESTDNAKKGEQLEELKSQIASLETMNAELTKKSEQMSTSYEMLKRDFDDVSFELDEVMVAKTETLEEKEKLRTGNEYLNSKLQTLQGDIVSLKAEKESIGEDKDKVETQNQELEEEIQRLNQEIAGLNQQLDECREASEKAKEELAQELEKVREEVEGLGEEKVTLSGKIAILEERSCSSTGDLNADVLQLQEELDMFKRGAPETKANIAKLESRVIELLNQLQTLNEEKLNQETALEELFKSHDDLSNKYDFECQEREKKEKEVSHLEEQLRSAQSGEGKPASSSDLEQQIDLLEETLNDMSVEKEHYRKELGIKEECIQQLRKDIEDLCRRHPSANSSFEFEPPTSATTCETERIHSQLSTVTEELKSVNTEKESLQAMMVEVITERDRLNESLDVVQTERSRLNESLEVVEGNMNLIKSQFDAKTLECEELRQQVIEHSTPNNSQIDINQQEEIRNLQNDLDYLDQQYKQVSKENIMLKEEFQSLVATKTGYQRDLEDIRGKLDQYLKEKMKLSDEIGQYNELTEKYGYDNVTDFDVFVTSLSSDVVTSTKMLQCLTAEKEQLDLKYTELENRLKNEKGCGGGEGSKDHEVVISKLKSEIDEKDCVFKEKEKELNEKDCIIKEKEKELSEKDCIIKEKDNELNEKDDIINGKDLEIKQLHTDLKCLEENGDFNNDHLLNEIDEYKNEVVKLNGTIESLQCEVEGMKSVDEGKSNDIQTKDVLINELRSELQKVRRSITLEQESYSKADNLHAELQEGLNEKEQRINELNDSLDENYTRLTSLQEEFDSVSQTLRELREKHEALETDKKHLEDINTCLEDNYASLQSTNDEALNEKNQLVEELNEKKQVLEVVLNEKKQLLDELNQITHVSQKVETKLQAALDKVVNLQNELEEKSEAMCELRSQLNEKEGALVEMKEKGDKGSKFKNAAVKAKRELEAVKQKNQEDIATLEEQIATAKSETIAVEEELKRQKTECSKHEEEFEEFQSEIKNLQTQLLSEQDLLRNVQVMLKEKEEEAMKIKEELKNKCVEIDGIKPTMEDMQKQLDNVVQENQQNKIKSLEIVDYERTVDNLQLKLDTKEKKAVEDKETIDKLKDIQRNLESEVASLKKENTDFENKNEKLKSLIVKLKKDISDKQKAQEETLEEVGVLENKTEQLNNKVDELKGKVANLNKEKDKLNSEITSLGEQHLKQCQTLEVKLARASNDLLVSQRENSCLAQEYEQYKVRAHNVLKQQKNKNNEEEEKVDNEQICHLEEVIHHLKQKLEESTGSFSELEARYQDIQNEYDGLQARHHEFIEEIGEKELAWKQKLTQVKLEASTKVLEYQDRAQLLQNENENLNREIQQQQQQQQADASEDSLHLEEKERYEEEIAKLSEEINRLRKKRVESPPNVLLLQKQDSNEGKGEDVKTLAERQEGEGMDSKELEIHDTLSQRGSLPHTPNTPSHASILERLLSPMQMPEIASPQSPTAVRDELLVAKSSLQTAMKKNEHMTGLIRESEANASRLADQAKILKEEIRRLERNEEREQALSNMEYLKNVIIKFLKVGSVEKEQLIPVISTMLKLSDDEKRFVMEYAKGEGGEETEGETSSWSSYVYRWTSLS